MQFNHAKLYAVLQVMDYTTQKLSPCPHDLFTDQDLRAAPSEDHDGTLHQFYVGEAIQNQIRPTPRQSLFESENPHDLESAISLILGVPYRLPRPYTPKKVLKKAPKTWQLVDIYTNVLKLSLAVTADILHCTEAAVSYHRQRIPLHQKDTVKRPKQRAQQPRWEQQDPIYSNSFFHSMGFINAENRQLLGRSPNVQRSTAHILRKIHEKNLK